MTRWLEWTWPRGWLVLILGLLYTPVAMVFLYSFNESRQAHWTGFSFKWYGELFQRTDLWAGLQTSLIVGLLASTLSVALGTLAALGLQRWGVRPRRLGIGLLSLPLVVPDIILAVALAIFFNALRLEQGLPTVILAHTTFGISYAFVVLWAAVQDLDPNLRAAALDCGATPWQAFWRVTFPLLRPSLVVAWLLVFALSFDDFLITFFTKGPGTDTLPIKIYGQMRFGIRPDTNALMVVLFLVTLAGALLGYRVVRPAPSK